MRKFLILKLISLCLVGTCAGQQVSKVEDLARAIAKAEGYGVKGARPTRNNNPGDLRAGLTPYPGQVHVANGHYVVFKSPEAGWNALRVQIIRIVSGQSRFYTPQTTINQMARKYAETWRPWAANVSRSLGVSGDTTLYYYFNMNRVTWVTENYSAPVFDDNLNLIAFAAEGGK